MLISRPLPPKPTAQPYASTVSMADAAVHIDFMGGMLLI
jgi:hypothetical protein